jgi:hypothetical protein
MNAKGKQNPMNMMLMESGQPKLGFNDVWLLTVKIVYPNGSYMLRRQHTPAECRYTCKQMTRRHILACCWETFKVRMPCHVYSRSVSATGSAHSQYNINYPKQKRGYPCDRPWRTIGMWDVEVHTFSVPSAHIWRWGCQPYAPTALYTVQRFFWHSFLLEAE